MGDDISIAHIRGETDDCVAGTFAVLGRKVGAFGGAGTGGSVIATAAIAFDGASSIAETFAGGEAGGLVAIFSELDGAIPTDGRCATGGRPATDRTTIFEFETTGRAWRVAGTWLAAGTNRRTDRERAAEGDTDLTRTATASRT